MVTVVSFNPGAIIGAFHDAGNTALKAELDKVLVDAQAPHNVPVLTGALRDSGEVAGPFEANSQAKFTIGFYTDYALLQHENLDFNHPRGGRAKYLETPLSEALGEMPTRVVSSIVAAVGGR